MTDPRCRRRASPTGPLSAGAASGAPGRAGTIPAPRSLELASTSAYQVFEFPLAAPTGPEQYIALFTDSPLEPTQIREAVLQAHQKAPDLSKPLRLDLPGDQVARILQRPAR